MAGSPLRVLQQMFGCTCAMYILRVHAFTERSPFVLFGSI